MPKLTGDYVIDNWAKLSPKFREAHNRLLCARGMVPIPEPKVSLWQPIRGPAVKPFDFSNKEFVGVAREFMGPMLPGHEGFSINGMSEAQYAKMKASQPRAPEGISGRRHADEGFKINGVLQR